MLKIGLTGGIGSGKTSVAKVFANLGCPIFFADDQAKKILITDAVKYDLNSQWGSDVFFENGEVDKAALANIVFNDSKELQKLNTFIHPKLMDAFNKWAAEQDKLGHKYVIMEAAILFEAGFHMDVDKTVCVTAPTEERISRVMNRDNTSKEQVESRMNSQWPQDKLIGISDYEIKNSNSDMVLKPIIKLHSVFSR